MNVYKDHTVLYFLLDQVELVLYTLHSVQYLYLGVCFIVEYMRNCDVEHLICTHRSQWIQLFLLIYPK